MIGEVVALVAEPAEVHDLADAGLGGCRGKGSGGGAVLGDEVGTGERMHEEVRGFVAGQYARERIAVLHVGAGRGAGAAVLRGVSGERGDLVAGGAERSGRAR